MLAGIWGETCSPQDGPALSERAQAGAGRTWFISRAWLGREGSGLGHPEKTMASEIHSKNGLALILKSEAVTRKTRKERVEIMPTLWDVGPGSLEPVGSS